MSIVYPVLFVNILLFLYFMLFQKNHQITCLCPSWVWPLRRVWHTKWLLILSVFHLPTLCLSLYITSLSSPLASYRLLRHLKLNSSLVFLAASVGIRPGAYAQRELMCLINTTLIICKLRVWVHITWEAYVARRVSRNKWLLNPISGVLASVDGPISL